MSSFFRNDKLLKPRQSAFVGVQAPSVQLEEPETAESALGNFLQSSSAYRQEASTANKGSEVATDIFVGKMNRLAAEKLPDNEGFKEFFARKYKAVDLMNDWVMSSMANNLGKKYMTLQEQTLKEWEILETNKGLNERHRQNLAFDTEKAAYEARIQALENQADTAKSIADNHKALLDGYKTYIDVVAAQRKLEDLTPEQQRDYDEHNARVQKLNDAVEAMAIGPASRAKLADLQRRHVNKGDARFTEEEIQQMRSAQEFDTLEEEAREYAKRSVTGAELSGVRSSLLKGTDLNDMNLGSKEVAVRARLEEGEYFIAPTDEEDEKIKTTYRNYQRIDELSEVILDARKTNNLSGTRERINGLIDRMWATLGANDRVAIYQSVVGPTATELARDFGERGVLTNQDRQIFVDALFKETDPKGVIMGKKELFDSRLVRNLVDQVSRSQRFGKAPKPLKPISWTEFIEQAKLEAKEEKITVPQAIINMLQQGETLE